MANKKQKLDQQKYRQTLLTEYFYIIPKKIFGYNSLTNSWHCLSCGIDMGPNNPRQLCGKYYCPENN